MKITTLILTHHPNPILGYKVIKSAPHVRIHWKTKNLSKISLRTKTIATNWASSSTLRIKYSSHSKASEIINEQNQDLGFAAGAEQVQQLLDSLVYGAFWVWVLVKTVENFGLLDLVLLMVMEWADAEDGRWEMWFSTQSLFIYLFIYLLGVFESERKEKRK